MKPLYKIFLYLITIFSGLNVYAQQISSYREDFENNKQGWSEWNDKHSSAKIENGKYILRNKDTVSGQIFWHQVYFDYNKDYRIEAKITQTVGVENYGFGLIWGAGAHGTYDFSISTNGNFCVYKVKDAEISDNFYEWTATTAIKPIKQSNILVVEKKGVNISFYINNLKVGAIPMQKTMGTFLGFLVGGSMTITVDYIQITHSPYTIDVVEKPVLQNKKEPLDTAINTKSSEIAPIISPDGKTLYFARDNHPQNIGRKDRFDIWYSELQADGKWSKAKNMGKPLNNAGDNVVTAISADGNTMIVETLYKPDGSFKSDQGISITTRTKTGWAVPTQLKITNYYNYNEHETFCPSVDREIMILSYEGKNSYGNLDLYVTFLQADGTYSTPKNLGATINTFDDDGTPYLAPDNETLYFSSEGRPGFGSSDIFVTKRLDDTWLKWSKPKNIGDDINSSDWDTYLTIAASGDYAYLVSTDNSRGDEDLCRIKLNASQKPKSVVIVKGTVIDKKTNQPIEATITYEQVDTTAKILKARSNPDNGAYKLVLQFGKRFQLNASADGYIPISETVDLSQREAYKEITKNLYLVPIEVGQVVTLNSVLFVRAKSILLYEAYTELDRLVKIMKTYPTMEIELGGHTDNQGDPLLNLDLSKQRVEAVILYLTQHGIAAERLTGKGYGGSRPISDNNTEEHRQLNRRVEFTIVKYK